MEPAACRFSQPSPVLMRPPPSLSHQHPLVAESVHYASPPSASSVQCTPPPFSSSSLSCSSRPVHEVQQPSLSPSPITTTSLGGSTSLLETTATTATNKSTTLLAFPKAKPGGKRNQSLHLVLRSAGGGGHDGDRAHGQGGKCLGVAVPFPSPSRSDTPDDRDASVADEDSEEGLRLLLEASNPSGDGDGDGDGDGGEASVGTRKTEVTTTTAASSSSSLWAAPLSAPPLSPPCPPFDPFGDPAWRAVHANAPVDAALPPLPRATLPTNAPPTPAPLDASKTAPATPPPPGQPILSIPPAQQPSLPLHYQPPAVFSLRYAIGDCLGSGGFGFVCAAAVRGKPGVEVAVKFILKEKVPVGTWARDEQLGIVPTEIYFLKRLNHPNIIKFIDCFEDALYFLLVTEVHGGSWSGLCPKPPAEIASDPSVPSSSAQDPAFARRASCDLFECIELLKNFTEPQAQYVFRQLISVVAYLESVGVLHRDIKDENVLINDSFEIKLIDFGSASFVTPHKRGERMFLGTLQYAPPEILEGRCHQGAKCEVWSLACCLYIMLVGEAPFTSLNEVRLSPPRSPRDRSIEFSPQCENLLAWMFEKDPARRPSISQVLFHPWLSGL